MGQVQLSNDMYERASTLLPKTTTLYTRRFE